MDVRYLQSFVTVIESGSVAEAARRLGLTPAAVSARIHLLEKELGAVLIQRSGRFVKASEAGVKILERAYAVLRDVRDLRAVASDGGDLGELRIGVFVSAMTSMLPVLLKQLFTDNAELKVFVAPGTSVELCRKVSAGALDTAIVVEPQFSLGKNCEWESIVEEPLVVIAPESLRGHDAHDALRTQPFIQLDRSVQGGQLADRYLRHHGIRPHLRLEIDGVMAVASLIEQGLGVSLLPDWAPMWTSGLGIVQLPLPGRVPMRRVGLVWDVQGPRASLAQKILVDARAAFGNTGAIAAPARPNP